MRKIYAFMLATALSVSTFMTAGTVLPVNSAYECEAAAKISKKEATSIALKDAGLKKSKVRDLEVEYKAKKKVYEVEFETKKYEYEYKIKASNCQKRRENF